MINKCRFRCNFRRLLFFNRCALNKPKKNLAVSEAEYYFSFLISLGGMVPKIRSQNGLLTPKALFW